MKGGFFVEYEKIVEVKHVPSYATTEINKCLKDGWIILNFSQYTYAPEGEAYGSVLLGRTEE